MKDKFNLNIHSLNFEKIFRRLIFIIPIGVIINVIFSYTASKQIFFPSLINFSIGYLGLAIVLAIIPWMTHALRLVIWSKFLDSNISFKRIFSIVLGNELGAAISPTAIGGAPVKVGMLIQHGMKPGNAVSLTTLGSIEDHLFTIFAVPIALSISQSWKLPVFQRIFLKFYNPTVGMVATAVFIFFVFRIQSKQHPLRLQSKKQTWPGIVSQKVRIFWNDFKLIFELIYRRGKIRFLFSMVLTTIQWICRYSVISALLAGLGVSVDPVRFFVLQWLVFTLMAFVPTPGATAGAETAFYLIYKSFCPVEIIGLVTTGWRFLTFYFLLILGIILFVLLNLPKKEIRKRWYAFNKIHSTPFPMQSKI